MTASTLIPVYSCDPLTHGRLGSAPLRCLYSGTRFFVSPPFPSSALARSMCFFINVSRGYGLVRGRLSRQGPKSMTAAPCSVFRSHFSCVFTLAHAPWWETYFNMCFPYTFHAAGAPCCVFEEERDANHLSNPLHQ